MGFAEFLGGQIRKNLEIGLGTIEGKAHINLKENTKLAIDLLNQYNFIVDEFLKYSNKILQNPKDRESALKAKDLFDKIEFAKSFAPFEIFDDIKKSKNKHLINFYYEEMDALKGSFNSLLNERQIEIDIMMARIRKKGKEISNDD